MIFSEPRRWACFPTRIHSGISAARYCRRGSMVIEILLSLALFSLICMPILIFVLSDDGMHRDIALAKSEAYSRNVSEQISWLNPASVRGYSNRHSCEGALAHYASGSHAMGDLSAGFGPASGFGSGPASPVFSIAYPAGFHHDRNTVTSIRSISHGGISYLVMGTDSASTTDPDLYVLSSDASSVIHEIESGPGIVDFDISGGYLYAVERSVVQPVWRMALDDVFGPHDSGTDATSTTTLTSGIGGTTTGSMTGIPVTLLGALPLRIAATPNWLYIGTDKSASPQGELLALKRIPFVGASEGVNMGSTTDAFFLQFGHEFDAGINDIAYAPDELLVATPNDHELIGLRLDPHTGSSPAISSDGAWGISRMFDAPGSAGNGKSLATYKQDVYLGRTVGNVEFYKLRNSSGIDTGTSAATTVPAVATNAASDAITSAANFSIVATADVNRTISQVEEIFGGMYVAMLIKTTQPALRIYEKVPSGSYTLAGEAALPAVPTSMTCTDGSFVIGMESTTTPLAIITL